MTNISEHDTKQEWEGYHVKGCWVGFLIVGNTISSTDFVVWPGEFVKFKVSWGCQVVVLDLIDLCDSDSTSLSDLVIDDS